LVTAIEKGAYVVYENKPNPHLIIIATGSELSLALAAAKQLSEANVSIRVVSMPCANRFLKQEPSYRASILPETVRARVAIEAASSGFWYQFVGLDGDIIGLNEFGRSAPEAEVRQALGITLEALMSSCERLLSKQGIRLETSFGEI
jgi:transketolase